MNKYHIRKCPKCGKYTLKDVCDICNVETKIVSKYKFKYDDPYFEVRIKEKYGV